MYDFCYTSSWYSHEVDFETDLHLNWEKTRWQVTYQTSEVSDSNSNKKEQKQLNY